MNGEARDALIGKMEDDFQSDLRIQVRSVAVRARRSSGGSAYAAMPERLSILRAGYRPSSFNVEISPCSRAQLLTALSASVRFSALRRHWKTVFANLAAYRMLRRSSQAVRISLELQPFHGIQQVRMVTGEIQFHYGLSVDRQSPPLPALESLGDGPGPLVYRRPPRVKSLLYTA